MARYELITPDRHDRQVTQFLDNAQRIRGTLYSPPPEGYKVRGLHDPESMFIYNSRGYHGDTFRQRIGNYGAQFIPSNIGASLHAKIYAGFQKDSPTAIITTGNLNDIALELKNFGLAVKDPAVASTLYADVSVLSSGRIPQPSEAAYGLDAVRRILGTMSTAGPRDHLVAASPFFNEPTYAREMIRAINRGARATAIMEYFDRPEAVTQREIATLLHEAGAEVHFGSKMHEKVVSRSQGEISMFNIGSVNLTRGPMTGKTFDMMLTVAGSEGRDLHNQYLNYVYTSERYRRYHAFADGRFGDFYRMPVNVIAPGSPNLLLLTPGQVYLPTRIDPSFFDLFIGRSKRPRVSLYRNYYRAITQEAEAPYWAQQFDRELADSGLGHALNRLIGFRLYQEGDGLITSAARSIGKFVDIIFGHYDHRYHEQRKGTAGLVRDSNRNNQIPPGFFENSLVAITEAMTGTAVASFAYVGTTFRHFLLAEFEERGFNYLLNVTDKRSSAFKKVAIPLFFGDYHGEAILGAQELMRRDPKLTFAQALEQFNKAKYGNTNPVMPYDFGEGFNIAGYMSMSRRMEVSNINNIVAPLLQLIVPESRHEELAKSITDLKKLVGQKIGYGIVSPEGSVTSTTQIVGVGRERMRAIASVLDDIANLVPANVFMWSPTLRKAFGFGEDTGYKTMAQVLGVGFMGRMVDAYQTFVHNLVDYISDPAAAVRKVREVFRTENKIGVREANLVHAVQRALRHGADATQIKRILNNFIKGREKLLVDLTQTSKDIVNLNVLGQPSKSTAAFRLMLATGAALAMNYMADAFLLRSQGVSLTTQLGLFVQVQKKAGRAIYYEFEGNVTPMMSIMAGTIGGVLSGFVFPRVTSTKEFNGNLALLEKILQKTKVQIDLTSLKTVRPKVVFNTSAALIGGAVSVVGLKFFAAATAWTLNQFFNRDIGYKVESTRAASSGALFEAVNTLYQQRRWGRSTSARNYVDEMVMEHALHTLYRSGDYGNTDQFSIAHQITLPFIQLASLVRSVPVSKFLPKNTYIDPERSGTQGDIREFTFGIQLAPTLGIGMSPTLPFGLITGSRRSLAALRYEERINLLLKEKHEKRDYAEIERLLEQARAHDRWDAVLDSLGINKFTYVKGSAYERAVQFVGAMTLGGAALGALTDWLDKLPTPSRLAYEYAPFRDLVSMGRAVGKTATFLGSMMISMPVTLVHGLLQGFNAIWIPKNVGLAGVRNKPEHIKFENLMDQLRRFVNASGPSIRAIAPFLITAMVASAATDPVTGMFRSEMNKFEDDTYRMVAIGQLTLGLGYALHASGVFANQQRLEQMTDNNFIRRMLGLNWAFKELKYGELARKAASGAQPHFTATNNLYRNAKRAGLAAAILYGAHLGALVVSHLTADSGAEALQNLYNVFPALQILSGVDAQQFNGKPRDTALARILHSINLGPVNLGRLFGLFKDSPDPFLGLIGPAGASLYTDNNRVKYYEQATGAGTKDLSIAFTSSKFIRESFDDADLVRTLALLPEGIDPNYVAALVRGLRPRQTSMQIKAFTGYEEDAASPLISMLISWRQYQLKNLQQQRPRELLMDLVRDNAIFHGEGAKRTDYRGFNPYNFSTYIHWRGEVVDLGMSFIDTMFQHMGATYNLMRRTLYPNPFTEPGRASLHFSPLAAIHNYPTIRSITDLVGFDEGLIGSAISLVANAGLAFGFVTTWMNTILAFAGGFAAHEDFVQRISTTDSIEESLRFLKGVGFKYDFNVYDTSRGKLIYQRLAGSTPRLYALSISDELFDKPYEAVEKLERSYRRFFREQSTHYSKVLFQNLNDHPQDWAMLDQLMVADPNKRADLKKIMLRTIRQDLFRELKRSTGVKLNSGEELSLFEVLHDIRKDPTKNLTQRIKDFVLTIVKDDLLDDLDEILESTKDLDTKRLHIKAKVLERYVDIGAKLAHSGVQVTDKDLMDILLTQEAKEFDPTRVTIRYRHQRTVADLLRGGVAGVARLASWWYPLSVGYTLAESVHYLGSPRRRLRVEAGEQLVRFSYGTALVKGLEKLLAKVVPASLQFGGWATLALSLTMLTGLEMFKQSPMGQGIVGVENWLISRLGRFVTNVAEVPGVSHILGGLNLLTRSLFDGLGSFIGGVYNDALKTSDSGPLNFARVFLAQMLLPTSLHKRDMNLREVRTYAGVSPLVIGDPSLWDEQLMEQRVQQLFSGPITISQDLLHPEVMGTPTGFFAAVRGERFFETAGLNLPARILEPFSKPAWQPSTLVRMMLQRRQHYMNTFVTAQRFVRPPAVVNASFSNQLLISTSLLMHSAFKNRMPFDVALHKQYLRLMKHANRSVKPLRELLGEVNRIVLGSFDISEVRPSATMKTVDNLAVRLMRGASASFHGALDDLFGASFRGMKRGLLGGVSINLGEVSKKLGGLFRDAGFVLRSGFEGLDDFALSTFEVVVQGTRKLITNAAKALHHSVVKPLWKWMVEPVNHPLLLPRVKMPSWWSKVGQWMPNIQFSPPSWWNKVKQWMPNIQFSPSSWWSEMGPWMSNFLLSPPGTTPNFDFIERINKALASYRAGFRLPSRDNIADLIKPTFRFMGGVFRGLWRMAPALMQFHTVNPERILKLHPHVHNQQDWQQAYREYASNLVAMRVGAMTGKFGMITSILTGLLAGKFAEAFGDGLFERAYSSPEAKQHVDRMLLYANFASFASLAMDYLLTPVNDFGLSYFDVRVLNQEGSTTGVVLSPVVERMRRAYIFTRSGTAGRLIAAHEMAHQLQHQKYAQRGQGVGFDLLRNGPDGLDQYYSGVQLRRIRRAIHKLSVESAMMNLDGIEFSRAEFKHQLALERDAWYHAIHEINREQQAALNEPDLFGRPLSEKYQQRLIRRGRDRVVEILEDQVRRLRPTANGRFARTDSGATVYRLHSSTGTDKRKVRAKRPPKGFKSRMTLLRERGAAVLSTVGTSFDVLSFLTERNQQYAVNIATLQRQAIPQDELRALGKAQAKPFYDVLVSSAATMFGANPILNAILGLSVNFVSQFDPLGIGNLMYELNKSKHERGELVFGRIGLPQIVGLNQNLSRYRPQIRTVFNWGRTSLRWLGSLLFKPAVLKAAGLALAGSLISPLVAKLHPGRSISPDQVRPWVIGGLFAAWGARSASQAIYKAALNSNHLLHHLLPFLIRKPSYSALKQMVRMRRFGSKLFAASLLMLGSMAFVPDDASNSGKYLVAGMTFGLAFLGKDILSATLPNIDPTWLGRIRFGRLAALAVGGYVLHRVATLPWQSDTDRLVTAGLVGVLGPLLSKNVRTGLRSWGVSLASEFTKLRQAMPGWFSKLASFRSAVSLYQRLMLLSGIAMVLGYTASMPDSSVKPYAVGLSGLALTAGALELGDVLIRHPQVKSFAAWTISKLKSKFPLIGSFRWSGLKYVPDRLYDWLVYEAKALKVGGNLLVNSLIGAALMPHNPVLGAVFGGAATAVTAPGMLPSVGKAMSRVYSVGVGLLQKAVTQLKALSPLPRALVLTTLGASTLLLIGAAFIKDVNLGYQLMAATAAVGIGGLVLNKAHNAITNYLDSLPTANKLLGRLTNVSTALVRSGILASLAYLGTNNIWIAAAAGVYGMAMTRRISEVMGQRVYAPAIKILGYSAAGYGLAHALGFDDGASKVSALAVGGLASLRMLSRGARMVGKLTHTKWLTKLGVFDRMMARMPRSLSGLGNGLIMGAGLGFVASKLIGMDARLGLASGAVIGLAASHFLKHRISFGANKFFALQLLLGGAMLGWEGYGLLKGIFEKDYSADEAGLRMGNYYSALSSIFSALVTNNNPFLSLGTDFAISGFLSNYGEKRGRNIATAQLGNAYLVRTAVTDTINALQIGSSVFATSPFGRQFTAAGGRVLSQGLPGSVLRGLALGAGVLRIVGPALAIGFSLYNTVEATRLKSQMEQDLNNPARLRAFSVERYRALAYEQTASALSAVGTAATVALSAFLATSTVTAWAGPFGWAVSGAIATAAYVGTLVASHVGGSLAAANAEKDYLKRMDRIDPSFRQVYRQNQERQKLKQQATEEFKQREKRIHAERTQAQALRTFNEVFGITIDAKRGAVVQSTVNNNPPTVETPVEVPAEAAPQTTAPPATQPAEQSAQVRTSNAPKPSEQTPGVGDVSKVAFVPPPQRRLDKEGNTVVAKYQIPDWVLNQLSAMRDLPLNVFAPPEAPELAWV